MKKPTDAPAPIDSAAACARLGVARQTLYAYVSRGLVRAAPHPEDSRVSLYDARDIEALAARKRRGRSREAVARATIDWGDPIMESAITRIADGDFYYRGRRATDLAERESLETVAALLIGAGPGGMSTEAPAAVSAEIPRRADPFARMIETAGALAAASAGTGADIPPDRLLRAMAESAAGLRAQSGEPAHALLARAWSKDAAAPGTLRRALVLCADHELNASTYAARVAASAGAPLQACVLAGLATLGGALHGGMTERCIALMDRLADDPNRRRAIRALGAKGPIPGFGHPLYPDGDPRAIALEAACGAPASWRRIVEAVHEECGVRPTLDYGLALVARRLALPPGAGLAIFATGRVAGWIAHALEQRATGKLIRPRAATAG